MQFEDFDNKAREAAEHHHSPFDEGAWNGMEKLLDKHMPVQEDDRRRIVLWLFLFLLIGGGLLWFFTDKATKGKKEKVLAATKAQSVPVKEPVTNVQPASPVVSHPNEKIAETPAGTSNGLVGYNRPGVLLPMNNRNRSNPGKPAVAANNTNSLLTPLREAAAVMAAPRDKSITETNTDAKPLGETKTINTTNNNTSTLNDEALKQAEAIPPVEDKSTVTVPDKKEEKKKDKSSSKRSPFFFTISAGPDVSAVGSSKSGDIKLLKGVGAGYTFRDRLTLRVGFYEARKIYSAAPADYKPAGTLPANWRYLTKVDADCKVYEVPVSLSWNIIHSKKHNVFAGAGMSSYFMKKESYDYFYKYPNSPQPVVYNHTVNNENKHYFSVLGLAAGFQQHLTPAISISAEPYIKVPLTGVGLGNVKLKSAGIMVSAVIQPFRAKTRKNSLNSAH